MSIWEPHLDRRDALKLTAGICLGGSLPRLGASEPTARIDKGRVEGHPEPSKAGEKVLAEGGNAVDAAVAAALVATVVTPHLCGVGGYGGHMIIATGDGSKVTAIDFNTTAPAAAAPDMFALDADGQVRGQANVYGWKAVGVPGTLAGLQLALDRFGSKRLVEVAEPALRLARDGFPVSMTLANAIRANQKRLANDPGSAKLLLPGGASPKAGSVMKNTDLAGLLETLAKRGSVESFYRGDIAAKLAAAYRQHGGLVTEADLAAYQAREVDPLTLTWRGATVRTPPPTAGGATVLETLAILKDLGWDQWPADDPRLFRARLEALRLAWDDRLKYFGDPVKGNVRLSRILSTEHATELAAKVQQALRDNQPVPAQTDGRSAGGTAHFSAIDGHGMMVAVTLTHGGSFGAQVTVDGLGLTLGHGLSRFDPRPGHPNSPGPGKRPLHNMCPTVVLHESRPVLAVGGRGGRRIPNAVLEVLAQFIGRTVNPADAIAASRLHTEGGLRVELEPAWPEATAARLKDIGYTVVRAPSSVVSAVWLDTKSGTVQGASR
jgi:gamma-glutamyltranspeptidase/glutathione hydrolase